MGRKDPRVDAYIAKAADFARPILEEIRARVHAACPAVEETMKWSVPAFDYKGPLCGMAAFKKHCIFGFWKSVKKNKKAHVVFDTFSPSHRREYLEWITDAKTEATRNRRVAQAIEWMAEGKPHNWKYM